MSNPAAIRQPDPHRGGRSITILVVQDILSGISPLLDGTGRDERQTIQDLIARDTQGFAKYGQNLETFDGRDTAMDAYQELLDANQYLRKLIEEHPDDPDIVILDFMYRQSLDLSVKMRGYLNRRKEGLLD